MKRYIGISLVVCAASLLSGPWGTAAFAQASKPAGAADDEVLRADRALVAALDKGDRHALDKMLDPELMWIDKEGIMWFREDAYQAGLKSLVPNGSDVKVTEHKYNKVVWIQNNQGSKYAAHFWVRRPAGWRLLHIVEIDQRPAEPGDVRPNYFVACDNPCNEIPYKPLTDSEKDAIRGWELMDSGDPALRAKYLGSGVTVASESRGGGGGNGAGGGAGRGAGGGAGGGRGGAGRGADGGPAPQRMVGAPPALFVRVWSFGDAEVSVMLMADYGARPYWASRVHFLRDGVWRMEESYHARVWAAPRLTAIPGAQPGAQSSAQSNAQPSAPSGVQPSN